MRDSAAAAHDKGNGLGRVHRADSLRERYLSGAFFVKIPQTFIGHPLDQQLGQTPDQYPLSVPGLYPDQGGGRATHAVFWELPAAVLLPHDGGDGNGASAGGHRDGDAGRQHLDGD